MLEQNITFLALKLENSLKKFFFFNILPVMFFGGGEFSPTVKPDSEKFLEPLPTFPLKGGVMGKFFYENHQQVPIFLREMVHLRKINM
jgi:hypothetical protein